MQLIVADYLFQTFWAVNWNNFTIGICGLSSFIAILTVLISSLLDTKAYFQGSAHSEWCIVFLFEIF